jgi:parvulin-like peptidyl-prolyl isomerase
MKINAAHILVNTLVEAQSVQRQLAEGVDFAQLAAAYSICPSGKQYGGNLGFFGKGQMVTAFEDAAYATLVGQVSEPVQTQFGFHLIRRLY